MKKYLLIILCLFLVTGPLLTQVYGSSEALNYRFDYTFRGQITGMLLLVFRYRLFFFASASVLLKGHQLEQNNIQFRFLDITAPGSILRSWGFRGRTFLTGIASFDLDKTNRLLASDKELLKNIEPDYLIYVKHWRRCPFSLPPREKIKLRFQRGFNGIHKDGFIHLPVKRVCKDDKYYFRFNIYPMLLDMINTYDHAFFTRSRDELLNLEPGTQWQSPPIDNTEAFNKVGSKAAMMVAKYVKFKQKHSFTLTYRVLSKTTKRMIIKGTASPRVKIWGSIKIASFSRTIQLRLPDGLLLEDSISAELSKSDRYAGTAACSLKRID